MPYNELLADRIRIQLTDKQISFMEKKMFGGLCFLVDEKMCIGIVKEKLMARIDPGIYEQALAENGCQPMDFTHRPMKGFVFVEPEAIDMEKDLEKWVKRCLEFNPKAKKSGK